MLLDRDAPLAIAIDPLDGSSNIDTNVSIGTIFSLLPATGAPDANPAASFLQPGVNQLAAGFFVYGPQLALVLSVGSGTHAFVLSTRLGAFVQAYESRIIPARTQEFAINAANSRHWDEAVRLYVEDCLKGCDGPRDKDFTMRWVASLVADCYRIWCAVACSCIPAISEGVITRDGCSWSMRRTRSPFSSNRRRARRPTRRPHPRKRTRGDCTTHALRVRIGEGSRRIAALPHHPKHRRTAPCSAFAACFAPDGRPTMSARHPIISITGSSGAGTTSVKHIFEQIFRRERIERRLYRGRRLPPLRPRRR